MPSSTQLNALKTLEEERRQTDAGPAECHPDFTALKKQAACHCQWTFIAHFLERTRMGSTTCASSVRDHLRYTHAIRPA